MIAEVVPVAVAVVVVICRWEAAVVGATEEVIVSPRACPIAQVAAMAIASCVLPPPRTGASVEGWLRRRRRNRRGAAGCPRH